MSKNHKRANTAGSPGLDTGDISLGSTFDAFENRLQRKLKEQAKRDDASQKLRDLRQARIFKAMNTIRKALQDTCKIRLGERFSFRLNVDEWQGWPRLELQLVDSIAPDRKDYGLIVSANDRNDRGSVVLSDICGKAMARIHLTDVEEMKRLPLVLKKTVRDFLDIVADYVLNPLDPEELLEVQTQGIEVVEEIDAVDSALQKTDLFTDDIDLASQNIVEDEEEDALDGISLVGENVFK